MADPQRATPAVERVDHVAIAVHDAQAAATFYTKRLGLEVVHDEIAEAPGVRLIYVNGGNTFIQLVQPVRECAISAWLAEHGEGLHHVCFTVPDVRQAVAMLGDPGEVFLGGRRRLVCFLTETPNNTLIELTESQPQP